MLASSLLQRFIRAGFLTGWLPLVWLLSLAQSAYGTTTATVFTYRSPESDLDQRYNYDTAVLRLALEKTSPKYGPFKLVPSPKMTFERAIFSLRNNAFVNFFVKQSYEERYVSEMKLTFVKFPVDRGIVGYRVCFTDPATKKRLQEVKTASDLLRFRHGQGSGWSDVAILRHHQFTVQEVVSYEALFKMVAHNRFDLFCRGTNELLDEWEAHKNIPNLVYDEAISIAYPLPRFFFTNAANQAAAQRVEEGLLMAFKDGSLQKLWHANYKKSIEFVRLDKRKIFWFDNPNLKNLNFNYRQYFYDPLADGSPDKLK